MRGGAAPGGGRSRPPSDRLLNGFGGGTYTFFPAQNQLHRTALHKVTESLLSSSLSFGVPTPPPAPFSPLHLDLLNTYTQQVLLETKTNSSMGEVKFVKDQLGCCGRADTRQLYGSVASIMHPLTIKTENIKRTCNTYTTSPKKMMGESGCSRTQPVSWSVGQGVQGVPGMHVQVKREPQLQMSELVAVKLEQSSPGAKHDQPPIPASLTHGSIPVGIAVARQRVGDAGLLAALSTQKDGQHRIHDMGEAGGAAMTVGGALLHCDDRAANQITGWPMTSHQPHPQAPPPAPALWQYPAQVSMESMMVSGMGMGGGGFQLVREPTSGALLLLPTAPPELPQTVLWGGYPPGPIVFPQTQPPAPMQSLGSMAPPLQLLPGDLLTSATLQHTQTHSTRLVALASQDKRKPIMQPLMTPHLIKIEAEPPPEKQYQEPLMATHVFYQPQNFQDQGCRSQATSPVVPLTPPPEATEPTHRDASNQTDAQLDEDVDSPNHADDDEREVACVGVAHSMPLLNDDQEASDRVSLTSNVTKQLDTLVEPATIDNGDESSSSEGLTPAVVEGAVEKAIDAIERDEAMDTNSSSVGSMDLIIDTEKASSSSQRSVVDVSGLELLSNSIEQFERTTPQERSLPSEQPLTVDTRMPANIVIKSSPKSPLPSADQEQRRFEFPSSERAKPSLDGLGLLCALAEQRFMEEVEDNPQLPSIPRTFVKSEPAHLLSPTEKQVESREIKHRRRTRDESSSSEKRRKRSKDREERIRNKFDKIRRHKRSKSRDEAKLEPTEAWRRGATCSCGSPKCHHPPFPAALVEAMEKDMREKLANLQRQLDALTPPLIVTPPKPSTPVPLSDSSDRGSSQKRKVGRPRKVSSPDSTETIVAKKPKSKSSLVSYLLAKGKLKSGILCSRSEPSKEDYSRTSKVRPKLKAEPKLKAYPEDDENDWGLSRSTSSSMESLHEVRMKNKEKTDKLARKHSRDDLPELEFAVRRFSASSESSEKERKKAKKRRKSTKSKDRVENTSEEKSVVVPQVSRCTLTEELLDSSPRVLTAMGGLFYAGKLSAVQAPDVYAITLDGERGNKPHILSREETLRDAIVEVTPSQEELTAGTRVCAYWSQQYRCLYPGTVAELPASPPPLDRFVAVEFDDGDSGTISIDDIRLLEPNYPVVEYDPNPLLTLGKRRRNTSVNSIDDKKPPAEQKLEQTPPTEEHHKDRKKTKKHRKEKGERPSSEGEYVKKKKKKHKCCDEHCKHRRHHKKHHKKHRKRHHSGCKEHSSSSGEERRHKSSDSKSNDDSVDSNERLSTLVAMEKSPDDKMKTVIKKTLVLKKNLVKTAVLDFSKLIKDKEEKESKDNLKDSGIGLEEEAPPVTPTKKKGKKRTVSSSSEGVGGAGGGPSKITAFLPGGALWRWSGAPYKRLAAKPRLRKIFYRAIHRDQETISVGDAAVFLSTGRPDRPYIGRVVALWEARGAAMAVKVRWFYHPEEATACPGPLQYPGGLFESPHTDENDVQTISHKCEVLPLSQYKERMGDDKEKYNMVYENNDVYYLAGHYDPTQQTIKMEPDIPFKEETQ